MTPIVAFVGPARSGKDTAAQVLCEANQGTAVAFADPIKRFLLGCGFSEPQLWGDEKEKEVNSRDQWPSLDHMPELLSNALNGWKSPKACKEGVDFKGWWRSLPDVITPRRAMQTFGTECVRRWNPDLWVDFGLYTAELLLCNRFPLTYYSRTEGVLVTGGHDIKPLSGATSPVNLVCFTDCRFRNEVLKVKQAGGRVVRIIRSTLSELSDQAKKHASETEQQSIPDWWCDAVIENDGSLERFKFYVSVSGMKSFP